MCIYIYIERERDGVFSPLFSISDSYNKTTGWFSRPTACRLPSRTSRLRMIQCFIRCCIMWNQMILSVMLDVMLCIVLYGLRYFDQMVLDIISDELDGVVSSWMIADMMLDELFRHVSTTNSLRQHDMWDRVASHRTVRHRLVMCHATPAHVVSCHLVSSHAIIHVMPGSVNHVNIRWCIQGSVNSCQQGVVSRVCQFIHV